MKRIFLAILVLNTTLIFSQDIYSELNLKKKQWVDSVYNSLSLEEKIAQLFINWVSPEQSDFEEIKKLVEVNKIGGLIFSIGTTKTHIDWLNKFQSISKTPLLVTMDAEWGPSQRLSDVFAHPWNMTLGAIQDNELVKSISKRMAEQNKALGINYNFSPQLMLTIIQKIQLLEIDHLVKILIMYIEKLKRILWGIKKQVFLHQLNIFLDMEILTRIPIKHYL